MANIASTLEKILGEETTFAGLIKQAMPLIESIDTKLSTLNETYLKQILEALLDLSKGDDDGLGKGTKTTFQGGAQLSSFAEMAGAELEAFAVGATAAAAFAVAIYEASEKVKQWSRNLIESNIRVGEFSPAMQMVHAQQELRDIELSMMRGDARAESTQKLADAMYQLDKTMMPLENTLNNIKADILTQLVGVINQFYSGVVVLADKIGIKLDGVDENLSPQALQHLTGYGAEKVDWAAVHDMPQRFVDGAGGDF